MSSVTKPTATDGFARTCRLDCSLARVTCRAGDTPAAGIGFAATAGTMAKLSETAQAAAPAFLKPDPRVPASLRELLLEADTCMENGLFIGATGCAQRAVDTLLKMEKAEGSSHDARVRSFGEKTPGLSQLYITVLSQLGDVGATVKLPTNTLQPLLATLKAVAYEIYVATPERAERSQYIRRLLDASGSKPTEVEQRKATPATLASMGPTGA